MYKTLINTIGTYSTEGSEGTEGWDAVALVTVDLAFGVCTYVKQKKLSQKYTSGTVVPFLQV